MPSLKGRVASFARSPQGKRFMRQAQDFAKNPETKRKIAETRRRFTRR